ncbi:MAG: AsmA family protein [Roseitalea porphyridii]
MRRGARRILSILYWLVALAAAAVILFVLIFDLDSRRDEIEVSLTDALGRVVTIDGDLDLEWGFTPVAVLHGVRVANTPGASDGDLARIERLAIRLALLPLLAGRESIIGLEADGVSLSLERLGDDRHNWDIADLRPVLDDLRSFELRDVAISFDGSPAIAIGRTSLAAADGGRMLEAVGNYDGAPWQLQVTLTQPVDGGAEDMTARLRFAGVQLSGAGSFGFDRGLPVVDMRGRLAVDDPALAARFLGLPQDLPAFQLEGGVIAGGTRIDVNDFTYRSGERFATGDATLDLSGNRPDAAIDLTTAQLNVQAVEATGIFEAVDVTLHVTADRLMIGPLTRLGRLSRLAWEDGVMRHLDDGGLFF